MMIGCEGNDIHAGPRSAVASHYYYYYIIIIVINLSVMFKLTDSFMSHDGLKNEDCRALPDDLCWGKR